VSFPVGVLVSGSGTNLAALIERVHGRDVEIVAVASNKQDAYGLQRAREAGIETGVFDLQSGEERATRDARLADWMSERGARLIVLAGYMQLLGPTFLERFPDAVINVHPSLLPAFPGLHAIEQAIDYGVRVFGVTVHFVDAGVDTGPIILQRAVELESAQDPDQVLAALRPLEHAMLSEAVALFAQGSLHRDPGNAHRVMIEGYARGDGPHE
jgi:phosphoribosylglycinamide formyltransferase-1